MCDFNLHDINLAISLIDINVNKHFGLLELLEAVMLGTGKSYFRMYLL